MRAAHLAVVAAVPLMRTMMGWEGDVRGRP